MELKVATRVHEQQHGVRVTRGRTHVARGERRQVVDHTGADGRGVRAAVRAPFDHLHLFFFPSLLLRSIVFPRDALDRFLFKFVGWMGWSGRIGFFLFISLRRPHFILFHYFGSFWLQFL